MGSARGIPAMSGHESGEYGLADVPEPPRPKGPPATGLPLPRLWKTEPDEDEEEPAAKASASQGKDQSPPVVEKSRPAQARPRGTGSRSKPAAKSSEKDGERTKALVEETPALDTYEARQRGRLI